MFSAEFLNELRKEELGFISGYLNKGALILEIGGGTGIQAKTLSESGFTIKSIDIPAEGYLSNREFDVIEYDGHVIPFSDNTFDIVFSSNVWEHIPHLDEFEKEVHRVLKPGGYCVHAMPTATWRLWSNVTHYHDMLMRIGLVVPELLPKGVSLHEARRLVGRLKRILDIVRAYLIPARHGERGNAFSEIWWFSRFFWARHFENNKFDIKEVAPMGILYTGYMALGNKFSFPWRKKLAKPLGSSCILYVVEPNVTD